MSLPVQRRIAHRSEWPGIQLESQSNRVFEGKDDPKVRKVPVDGNKIARTISCDEISGQIVAPRREVAGSIFGIRSFGTHLRALSFG